MPKVIALFSVQGPRCPAAAAKPAWGSMPSRARGVDPAVHQVACQLERSPQRGTGRLEAWKYTCTKGGQVPVPHHPGPERVLDAEAVAVDEVAAHGQAVGAVPASDSTAAIPPGSRQCRRCRATRGGRAR